MHRLSGTDSGFLAMEAPWQPMFNVGLAESDDGPLWTPEGLREHVAGRLDQLPAFRRRVVAVPGGLHHPVAVDDPDFDLDAHLGHVDLRRTAEHGTTLDEVFAALAEEPLPADRPLWRLYLVDGIGDGAGGAGVGVGGRRQALVLHFHHAIADGTAAMAAFRRLFSDAPTPPVDAEPYRPRRLPGRVRLVAGAVLAHLVGVLRFVAALLGAYGGLKRLRARKEEAAVEVPPISEGAPWTPLNDAFTLRRASARVVLPLAELREVRRATGGTLNDVVLGVVSGALRSYLGEDLPAAPLLCNVPMSDEPADAPERTDGNNFWSVTTTLATDEADPLERLARISAVTGECKQQLLAFGVSTVPTLLDVVPPVLLARGTRRVSQRLREATEVVDANVLVSNVRGAAEPFTLLGRTVERAWVCGPPSNGIGCNVSVMSYGTDVLVCVLAYADALADPARFALALIDSHAELVAACDVAGAATA